MMEIKLCKYPGCNNICESNRRVCRQHYLQRKRQQAKERYLLYGKHKYKCVCEICKKIFDGDRITSKYCHDCYHKLISFGFDSNNNYEHYGCQTVQHIFAKNMNLIKTNNDVVHHIDCNCKNNQLSNLVVISRADHIKIHKAIALYRLKGDMRSIEEITKQIFNTLNINYKILE